MCAVRHQTQPSEGGRRDIQSYILFFSHSFSRPNNPTLCSFHSRGVAAVLNNAMPAGLSNTKARLATVGSGRETAGALPIGVVEQEAQLGDLVAG